MNLPSEQDLNSPTALFIATSLSRLTSFLRRHAVILLPALTFFGLVVAMNWRLFVNPLAESGDIAFNALQVQNAKHLHELLGNYSRWHFHHPGPFFFYLFGAGEAILFDLLHLVPTPLNAEYLAEAAFSTACLFLAIHIFYVNIRKPFFPALAVLFTVLYLYAVETAIPASAIVALWPPYMSSLCFLLMAACCASVAAGNWNHIPLMALSAMIMIHSHVAQLLFASVLTLAAVLTLSFREIRRGNLLEAIRSQRRHLLAALSIVVLFLAPIAIDWAIHKPSNIDDIASYLKEHRGEHNSLSTTLLYASSFLTYNLNPDSILAKPGATLSDLANPAGFVKVYWSIFLCISLVSMVLYFSRKLKIPFFVKYVFAEIALIVLLFLYWSWRITGPMYMFNGYFFFSVQLLLLLVFGSLISGAIWAALKRPSEIALPCALSVLILLNPGIRTGPESTDVVPIVASIKERHVKGVVIVMPFQIATILPGAGVASYLKRSGIYFCMPREWQFAVGSAHTCKNTDGFYQVTFSVTPLPCAGSCSIIYSRPGLYVLGTPVSRI